jgi:hypothetical protein
MSGPRGAAVTVTTGIGGPAREPYGSNDRCCCSSCCCRCCSANRARASSISVPVAPVDADEKETALDTAAVPAADVLLLLLFAPGCFPALLGCDAFEAPPPVLFAGCRFLEGASVVVDCPSPKFNSPLRTACCSIEFGSRGVHATSALTQREHGSPRSQARWLVRHRMHAGIFVRFVRLSFT